MNKLESDRELLSEFLNLALYKKVKDQNERFPDGIFNVFRNEKLIRLNLKGNHRPIIPDLISKFSSLESLWLGDEWKMNEFVSLPESLGKLFNLKVLKIENSNISSFPESFSNLKNLEVLEVPNANLSVLPDSVCEFTNLRILNLSDNKLTGLPAMFSNLNHLEILDLENNNFTVIPDSLCQVTSLKEIDFVGNSIRIIPKCIENLKKLVEFDVENNYIKDISHISKIKQQLPNADIFYGNQKSKS